MASQPVIKASERIRELSAINEDVARLLTAAGQAVNALTNRPLKQSAEAGEDTEMIDENTRDTAEAHKEAFTSSTANYYTLLQSITARLRRDVYALEEAGIIAAEAPKLGRAPQPAQAIGASARAPAGGPGQKSAEEERIINGGLGSLDVGWLNSRGNRVGAEKEAELLQEAENLLERLLTER